jgi:O-antigen/teichoic acid export membrane protein
MVVGSVPAVLVATSLPVLSRAARDDPDRLAYAMQRIFEVSVVAGLASLVGFVTGAGFVIHVVGGAQYGASIEVLQIQAGALFASFVLAGWAFGLLSLRRHRELLLSNAAAFVISCALTITLAGVDGARGAAVATVAGETTLAVATLLALVRTNPKLRPGLARAWRALPAAGVALAAGLIPTLPSLVAAVLALGVFGGLVLAFRALPDEVFEPLPRRLRPRRL